MSDSLPTRAASVHLRVLWATSAQYERPQMVGAWSDGLYDSMREEFEGLVAEAKEWFEGFDDAGPWTYWVTAEALPEPAAPTEGDT